MRRLQMKLRHALTSTQENERGGGGEMSWCGAGLGKKRRTTFLKAHLGADSVGDGANAVNLTVDDVAILAVIKIASNQRRWCWPSTADSARRSRQPNRPPPPTLSQSGSGLRKQPTPEGVPVKTRSPGSIVTKRESQA